MAINAYKDMENNPMAKKIVEFVSREKALREEYGLRPTEVHVNPGDEFLIKFGTICGMRVVMDYHVPRGNLQLL